MRGGKRCREEFHPALSSFLANAAPQAARARNLIGRASASTALSTRSDGTLAVPDRAPGGCAEGAAADDCIKDAEAFLMRRQGDASACVHRSGAPLRYRRAAATWGSSRRIGRR
jgi:hypothetical protein